jgi:hypothetical protein
MSPRQADTLHSPRLGCTTYAVLIYNRTVRARMKENKPNHLHSDRWAEAQTHEVCADSVEDARRIAAARFPAGDGFVITDVVVAGAS